ncbi:uncharacterized protein LOC141612352 [Silene latifolia]|uniref:uncharacterized protein LOC141612352 n=1 Tax=Silene latifolia TaxID=37657 RepID=UPI003D77FD7A
MEEEVQLVLEFLRKNGFKNVEFALKEDLTEINTISTTNNNTINTINNFNNNVDVDDGCLCDLEKFVFPMMPPPVKLPIHSRRTRVADSGLGSVPVSGLNSGSGSGLDESGDDEFKSMKSSTSASGVYSSDFSNPYGQRSTTQPGSGTSSDRLSQFGTAREYQEFDMQTDLWYDDKDDGPYMTPSFGGLDPFGCPTEDKFVMTSETGTLSKNPFSFNRLSEGSEGSDSRFEYPFQSHDIRIENIDNGQVKDYYHLDDELNPQVGIRWELDRAGYSDVEDIDSKLKEFSLKDSVQEPDGSRNIYEAEKQELLVVNRYDFGPGDCKELVTSSEEPNAAVNEPEGTAPEEIPYWEANEDEYEVFDLRIIHRKNRTGFEESKEFPIVLQTVIAGRYYVTEYLGSAAFSKVVQAHDLQTGIDVCLKIIKNDKDFFDQSLDEIKLLKYVNKHDPVDEHHLLRLYDYFYHQEHLFIVCELLRANLYEFQKYNMESGGEPYFTMGRLQAIARQCLEALDYLHGLGIIHCDLKPENVLIKSYSRCEIKVIDLGSSCFQNDNLCLYVQSRSYRAPEVILGLPYGPKIDIWSLGCILAELCSGEVLFPNDGVVMLLARMIGLIGPIDLEMLLRGQETHKYFTKEFDLYHIIEDTDQMEFIIPEQSSLDHHLPVSDSGFMEFLKHLLQINPRGRPTARQALDHPWLSFPY